MSALTPKGHASRRGCIGDTFDLPTGATLLRSDLTDNQAFRFGACAWGIQFHPEVTRGIVESMLDGSQAALLLRAREELPRVLPIVAGVFDRFVDAIVKSPAA